MTSLLEHKALVTGKKQAPPVKKSGIRVVWSSVHDILEVYVISRGNNGDRFPIALRKLGAIVDQETEDSDAMLIKLRSIYVDGVQSRTREAIINELVFKLFSFVDDIKVINEANISRLGE